MHNCSFSQYLFRSLLPIQSHESSDGGWNWLCRSSLTACSQTQSVSSETTSATEMPRTGHRDPHPQPINILTTLPSLSKSAFRSMPQAVNVRDAVPHIKEYLPFWGHPTPIEDRPGPDRRLMMLKVGDFPRCQSSSLGCSRPCLVTAHLYSFSPSTLLESTVSLIVVAGAQHGILLRVIVMLRFHYV